MSCKNQTVTPAEVEKIQNLDAFDLVMLLSQIHDHGWPAAQRLLPMMPEGTRQPMEPEDGENEDEDEDESDEPDLGDIWKCDLCNRPGTIVGITKLHEPHSDHDHVFITALCQEHMTDLAWDCMNKARRLEGKKELRRPKPQPRT